MSNEHGIRKLAGLDDWQLEDSDQDLRGKMLRTADGRDIGEIDDMLADTDQERVVGLRLADGRVVNVDSVDIRDGAPVLLVDQAQVPPPPAGVARGEVTSEHIPIVEEQMVIGKRLVELGTVRVRTRVVSDDVSENVVLREEHVNVDRRALNERISAADADALFQEGTVEITETGEEAVVTKEAVITGEIVVDKNVDTRTERVDGTVRRTEVDVDRDGSTDR
ncbi:DUF2382 domain-containing protein [Sphingomonas sp.]|uniref:DUF2382 domain-containing protein n=1 Tax=Sphingomonas sp. TaxID=28214 RepID=UPI0035C7C52C